MSCKHWLPTGFSSDEGFKAMQRPGCRECEVERLRVALRDIALGLQPCDYGRCDVACQRMADTAIDVLST